MPIDLIKTVFKYALYLGIAGHLVDATLAMRRKAFNATQQGLISLGAMNRALTAPIKKEKPFQYKK